VHQLRLAAEGTEPTPATRRFLDDEAGLIDLLSDLAKVEAL